MPAIRAAMQHLLPGLWLSFICTSSIQCTPQTPSPETMRTSGGEELRVGLPGPPPSDKTRTHTTPASADARSPQAPQHASAASKKTCLFAIGGLCLPTQTLHLWTHASSHASRLSYEHPHTCKTPPSCSLPQGFQITQTSYQVLRPQKSLPAHIRAGLSPVYSLMHKSTHHQYLTRNHAERASLQKQQFRDEGILYFVTPGKGFGNRPLYRYRLQDVPGSYAGPWHYAAGPSPRKQSAQKWLLDGNLGAVLVEKTITPSP